MSARATDLMTNQNGNPSLAAVIRDSLLLSPIRNTDSEISVRIKIDIVEQPCKVTALHHIVNYGGLGGTFFLPQTVRPGYCTINFKDPVALRELTQTLASHYFSLELDLPLDRLIPTLPLRLNYLHWIEDLISFPDNTTSSQVRGLDIGTGASAIYPLLGSRVFSWTFLATERDEESFSVARCNVTRNKLDDKVIVRQVTDSDGRLASVIGWCVMNYFKSNWSSKAMSNDCKADISNSKLKSFDLKPTVTSLQEQNSSHFVCATHPSTLMTQMMHQEARTVQPLNLSAPGLVEVGTTHSSSITSVITNI
eukprot:sb/3467126/